MSILFHDGNRALQDRFGRRPLADRLEEKLTRTAFTDDDKAFIEARVFFLATADAEGRPDCSFKGGVPGFVRVTGPSELAFPDYDGNGMFKSLGNVVANPKSACCSSPCTTSRNGCASTAQRGCQRDDPLLAETVGAQLIVRVTARAIFPNCPRYIPDMQMIEPSVYTPQPELRTGGAGLERLRHLQGRRAAARANGDLSGALLRRLTRVAPHPEERRESDASQRARPRRSPCGSVRASRGFETPGSALASYAGLLTMRVEAVPCCSQKSGVCQ